MVRIGFITRFIAGLADLGFRSFLKTDNDVAMLHLACAYLTLRAAGVME